MLRAALCLVGFSVLFGCEGPAPVPAAAQAALEVGEVTQVSSVTHQDLGAAANPDRILGGGGGRVYVAGYDWLHGIELWSSVGDAAPTLVRDIAPGSAPSLYETAELVHFNGRSFFFADDAVHGPALWQSDGTSAGTRMVRDIQPGGQRPAEGRRVVATTDAVYFALEWTTLSSAGVVDHLELWRTDGTEPGTAPVVSLADEQIPELLALYAVGPLAFYVLDTPFSGSDPALWRTDGTAAGTFQVGTVYTRDLRATALAHSQTHLYFVSKASGSAQLWRSDGTLAGTVAMTAFASDLRTEYLAVLGDEVVFSNDIFDTEPWITDDSEEGASRLLDVNPGASASGPRSFTVAGGYVFFEAHDGTSPGLWRTDGTPEGTIRLASLSSAGAVPMRMGSRLLFMALAENGSSAQPAVSDGTVEGTVPLSGVLVDPYRVQPAVVIDDATGYFLVGLAPARLLATDGTPAGTRTLPATVNPAPSGSAGWDMVVLGERVVFTGSRSAWGTPVGGGPVEQLTAGLLANGTLHRVGDRVLFSVMVSGRAQLFETDGTVAGTRQLTDHEGWVNVQCVLGELGGARILVGSTSGTAPYSLLRLEESGALVTLSPADPWTGRRCVWVPLGSGRVYAAMADGALRPFFTDGTVEGTRQISATAMVSASDELVAFAGAVYFAGHPNQMNHEMWLTDGTEEGTQVAFEVRPDQFGSRPTQLTVVGDRLFFRADVTGAELYVSDGTGAGTFKLPPFPGVRGSEPTQLTEWQGRLLFFADDGVSGRRLVMSDGTPEGTHPLPLPALPAVEPNRRFLHALAEGPVFIPAGDAAGNEPWMTCGAEFAPVGDLFPGEASSDPSHFVQAGGKIFFLATVPSGVQLFSMAAPAGCSPPEVSDGGVPGTDGGTGSGGGDGGSGNTLDAGTGNDGGTSRQPEAPGSCGCGSTGGAALPTFLFAALLVRRRRRPVAE